jgi:hypothetical protein
MEEEEEAEEEEKFRIEVWSDKAWSTSRAHMGEEGLEKGTSHVVSQVQLLPFCSGTSPGVYFSP